MPNDWTLTCGPRPPVAKVGKLGGPGRPAGLPGYGESAQGGGRPETLES